MGGRWVVPSVTAASIVATALAPLGAWSSQRRVLGTLTAQGEVRVDGAAAAAKKRATPLLDGAKVEVGAKSAAMLGLNADGIVGLRAGSEATASAADGIRVGLARGEALIRIPRTSRVRVVTATAVVRPDAVAPVATGATRPAEASIQVTADGKTVVRVQAGSLQVEDSNGAPTAVKAGQEASIDGKAGAQLVLANATTVPAPAAAAASAATPPAAAGGSVFAVDPLLIGLSGVTAVGATVGGLAGTGAIGGDDDDDDEAAAPPGNGPVSPFKTP